MRRLLLATLVLGCAPSEEPPSAPRSADASKVDAPKPEPTPPPSEPAAMPKPEAPDVRTCLATFEMSKHRSVLEEQRRRGGAKRWDDFPERYRAEYLDPDTQQPVDAVAELKVGGTPFLWFSPDFSEAVVNAAVLTELTMVDVTRLASGTRVRVGGLTELGLGMIQEREFLRFLVLADVIRTYVHMESTVCLREERDDEAGYHAELDGEHVYFTNEENHDELGFMVDIDPEGGIWVTGTG